MIGTQITVTLIAVHDVVMHPLGWARAGAVWAYALLWFLVNDRIELAAYRWLDGHPRTSPPKALPSA